MIKINYSYTILFAATVAGVGTAADSTPTAVLWRNGSASGVSVTVSTTAQTGLYKAVFTTDAGWAAADYLELYVTATIAGTAGYLAKVWSSTEIGAVELDSATQAQLDRIEAANGTGARTVTITVNDGTSPLQNALVRMSEGANTFTAATNASGIASFNLDDFTYTVAVTKPGYFYAGTTMVVNGTETATYSMTAINVTPGTGNLTTGYLTCLNESGAAEQNVSVRCQMVQVPTSGTGIAYDAAVQLDTSDSDGLVEFPMIKGARYLVWRGSIKPPQGLAPVLISASAGTTTALGSLIGVD